MKKEIKVLDKGVDPKAGAEMQKCCTGGGVRPSR